MRERNKKRTPRAWPPEGFKGPTKSTNKNFIARVCKACKAFGGCSW